MLSLHIKITKILPPDPPTTVYFKHVTFFNSFEFAGLKLRISFISTNNDMVAKCFTLKMYTLG